MMQQRFLQLALILSLLLNACTDSRAPQISKGVRVHRAPAQGLVAVSDVKFDGKNIETLQMMVKGPSMFLSGRPFGFSRWDIASNPEVPTLTFAQARQIDTFPLNRTVWAPDYYAQGALATLGSYAIMSGQVGASVVDISDTHNPKEVRRYPTMNEGDTVPVQDPDFQYKAMAVNPNSPIVYGFREQDFVATLSMTGPDLKILNKTGYSEGGTCCVKGATVFANRVFVAFRSAIWMFDMNQDGALSNPLIIDSINAVNIASTGRFLYVQHEPINNSNGASKPAGIYVFDTTGESIAFLPSSPFKFAVATDDSYLYANIDNTAIRIFRIDWQSMLGVR